MKTMKMKPLPTETMRCREINNRFVGKTIKQVKILGLNSWEFHFTDGTSVTIDTFAMGHGIYGPDLI
jgi:hypothetical protein